MLGTFSIFSASVLPGLVYVSMGLFLVFKRRRHEENSGVFKDYVIFLFVLALCFVSGALAAWISGDPPASSMLAGHTVLKLYLVSSLFPCAVLHRLAASARPYFPIYVYLGFVTGFVALMEILLYSGCDAPFFGNLCRGAVTANLLVFLYLFRCVIVWSQVDKDAGRRQLARELFIHIAILSVYNMLFLMYSLGLHLTVSYFILVTGFAVIHVIVVAAVSQGQTIDAFLLRRQEYGEDAGPVYKDPSSAVGQDSRLAADPKNIHSGKAETDVLSLKERLLGYFESEKPYLSKTISMEEVAMRLYTNKSYLSKTINVEMNKNFRELVNYFRVKEAINIFTSNMEISVSELRDRCGFNNNASFTSAFKLNTGYTPGEWCRDMKQRREKAMNKGK